MEKFKLNFKEDEPKYLQICNHIKVLINSEGINDGDKLPTIRGLAKLLGVNNVTIINCYKKLQDDGYAYQKMGSGTYVKKKESLQKFKAYYSKEIKNISREDNLSFIDFTGESKGEVIFPINNFKKILNFVLNRDGAEALLTEETLGYSELRETINNIFWNSKNDINNMLIVSGAQQGIDIISKAMLNINDNVIVEKPTYGGALSVFKWRRANVFSVPILEGGIDIKKFEEIIKKNNIKCFYSMSYFHNPTGISYSLEVKKHILELAEKYDFYIIEDDYLSEVIYDNKIKHEPFKVLDKKDRVIYIRSFSKIFLPGIRLGYIIYPAIFKDSIQSSKINTDIVTSTLMQRALELYIKDGYYKEHIKTITESYKNKYHVMKDIIDSELLQYVEYNDPKGGLSFYLKIKDKSIDCKKLFLRLKKRGVYMTPGVVFYRDLDEGLDAFRVSFAKVSEKQIEEGIKIIKEELEGWHT